MGLVSCLDQLGLQVLCVRKLSLSLMSSLPVDQPFRYDGPVGSHGREAGFILRSSIVASPVPGTPDSQSLRAGVSSRAFVVSAHFMRHMLALPLTHASSSGARLQRPSCLAVPLRHPTSARGGL